MQKHNWRHRISELLEHDNLPHSVGARLATAIIAVVVIDVAAMVAASVPSIVVEYGGLLRAIEIAALLVFTLEYAARLWSAGSHAERREVTIGKARRDYVTSSLGVIDLAAVLPVWLAVATGDPTLAIISGCLPLLKLVRYSNAMRSLLAAIYAERRTLIGCLGILLGAVLIFATLLYAIERDVQPEKFGTIPLAMWWAIVTLGTVGYGDVIPVTALGKAVATFTIIGGLMMIALPVAIVSSAFANEVRRHDFIVTWRMLARVPLFAHLNAAEIADIMRLLRAQTIDAGEILVRRGEPAGSMYFIAAGEVEIALPNRLVRLADGDFFGEVALLQRTRRSGTVTAIRQSNLLALDAQDFRSLIARAPKLAQHLQNVARARQADSDATTTGDIADDEIAKETLRNDDTVL